MFDSYTLHESADAAYKYYFPPMLLLSRSAAIEAIKMLSSRGYQLYGIDGGIFHSDDNFEGFLDAAWSSYKTAKTAEDAETINMIGVRKISGDPQEYNAYRLLVHSFR